MKETPAKCSDCPWYWMNSPEWKVERCLYPESPDGEPFDGCPVNKLGKEVKPCKSKLETWLKSRR
jgi:hypothetical protein